MKTHLSRIRKNRETANLSQKRKRKDIEKYHALVQKYEDLEKNVNHITNKKIIFLYFA